MKRYLAKKNQLDILIIGLGNVAIGYDLQSSGNRRKTHLFAINDILLERSVNPRFYGVDPDINARSIAESNILNLQTFSSLAELPDIHFDLVIICVPIDKSYSVTCSAIDILDFDVLCLEKPGVATKSQATDLNRILLELPNVFILYSRRSLPSSRELRSIYLGENCSDYQIEFNYSGSTINILSHFFDLIEYIFGFESSTRFSEFQNVKIFQTSAQNMNDHQIKIIGPNSLDYSYGGKQVRLLGKEAFANKFNTVEEIESQIWYTALHYLNFIVGSQNMNFPSRISDNISALMEDQIAIN